MHSVSLRIFQFLIRDVGQSLLQAFRDLLAELFGLSRVDEEVQVLELGQDSGDER